MSARIFVRAVFYVKPYTVVFSRKSENGTFVKDAETTEIATKNGYELARRKGNYDALAFIDELINETVICRSRLPEI